MDFKNGEKVFAADGSDLGRLDRTVIDPRTREVVGIVVKKGIFFKEDKVIPIEHIGGTQGDRINLKDSPLDWDSLPNFEETRYIAADERDLLRGDQGAVTTTLLWYPPPPPVAGLALPGAPGGPALNQSVPEQPIQKDVDRNIPPGTVALQEGAKVISADDQDVGNIDQLLIDPQNNQVTHFVISKGAILKGRIAVPADWVTMVMEDEVHLAVRVSVLSKIPPYRGE